MDRNYNIELNKSLVELSAGSDSNAGISIKSIVDTARRRYWLICLGFLAVFCSVAAYTFTQTPVYNATAEIIVDTNEKNVINIAGVMGGLGADTAVIDTEVEVMGSKSLLAKVVERTDLIENPEFNPFIQQTSKSPLDGIKTSIKSLFGMETAEDPFEGLSEEEKEALILETVVNNFIRNVSVSRVGTTFIITAQVRSEDPKTAATLANAIADQYRTNQLDEKLEATRVATDWLSVNVEELASEVADKQRRVEDFRASSGLLEASGTRLTEQNLTFLESDRSRIKSSLDEARSRYENVRNTQLRGGDVTSLAEVLDSAVIADLKSQRAAVLRRQADLQSTLGPRHPAFLQVQSEVADIEAQIEAEVARVVARLEQAVRIAERQYTEKNRQIANERGELARNNRNTVELKALERDARTSEELYEEFLSRFKETRPQNDIAEADARILSRASVPDAPSTPRTIINLLLGIVLGGLVGGGLAVIAEIFDTKFSSVDEVQRKLGMSSLGSIPQIKNKGFLRLSSPVPADFMVENPFTAYAESIRYMRAAIAFSDLDSNIKTVAVTSSLPDEGKTSMTLSLGRMSAISGSRTLVIDGDFRRRQLTEISGLKTEQGLIEHLFKACSLDEVIQRDSKTALDLLPLSVAGHTPHDVFGTEAFDKLMVELRERYDLILIDTGPLLLMAEARVIAGKCDKTLLVVRWRATTVSVARRSIELLKTFNANILGVVLNRVDLTKRRYHKDPSTASKAYKKYYSIEPKRSFRRKSENRAPAAEIAPFKRIDATIPAVDVANEVGPQTSPLQRPAVKGPRKDIKVSK